MGTDYVDIRDEIQTARIEGRKEVVDFVEIHIFPLLKETSISVYFKDRWNEAIKKWLE